MARDDLDKDAISDDGIWRECADRLQIAQAAESENRKKGVKAIKFRWGEQWPDDVKNSRKSSGRPALTINHANVFCQRQENTLRQQRPRIKVHPVGDGANVDTAATVQGIIRHIENRSYASVAYDRGAKGAVDIGWGYWRIAGEFLGPKSMDQELKILPIRNHFSVYMDPGAKFPDGRDQKWCIISETMKRQEYKRRYPKAQNIDYSYVDSPGDLGILNNEWEGKEEIRLAEYYRIHEVRDTLCLMNDGSTLFKSELPAEELRTALNYQPQIDPKTGTPVERPSTRLTVEWFRLNGKEIVERTTIPGRYIPVIRSEGNVEEIDGKTVRKGMVEDLIDPAQMYNYWRTAQTERYALAPKAPWVVAEGQTDGHPEWNDANQKSYSTLVYKAVTVTTAQGEQVLPPPQRQPPVPVEEGMAAAAAGAEHDLMSVAGMPQENPELASRIVGGNKYLQRRQGMQDLTHFQYYDNQTLAIAWTGEVLLEMIPHYYDTERMQRIIGEDGVPQVVKINEQGAPDDSGVQRVKNDMTVGLYSVVMDTGPGYATKREEAAENMVEVLGTPLGEVVVQQGADLVLRNMDWHGADELADRVASTIPAAMEKMVEGLPKQAQNIIGSMQKQLQDLQGQLQQAQLEIKYQGSVKEMQVHGKLEEIDRNNENRVQVEHMKGATSRDVAEIHGATQLLNTRAEAEGDEKAARALIDAGTKDRAE